MNISFLKVEVVLNRLLKEGKITRKQEREIRLRLKPQRYKQLIELGYNRVFIMNDCIKSLGIKGVKITSLDEVGE